MIKLIQNLKSEITEARLSFLNNTVEHSIFNDSKMVTEESKVYD